MWVSAPRAGQIQGEAMKILPGPKSGHKSQAGLHTPRWPQSRGSAACCPSDKASGPSPPPGRSASVYLARVREVPQIPPHLLSCFPTFLSPHREFQQFPAVGLSPHRKCSFPFGSAWWGDSWTVVLRIQSPSCPVGMPRRAGILSP